MPTVRTSPDHRGCPPGDDQGQPAGLHHQLRRSNVAATVPKVVDDHLGYGGAPAYLTACPGEQDGVVIEQACIVEPARPSRIAPLLMSAYGLTERWKASPPSMSPTIW